MPLTYSKSTMPNQITAIKIDGFEAKSIFLRIKATKTVKSINQDGVHRAIIAYAQEVDATGADVAGSIGTPFCVNMHPDGIVSGQGSSQFQLREVRRMAVKNFLIDRRTLRDFTNIPDNLADIAGALEEPAPE